MTANRAAKLIWVLGFMVPASSLAASYAVGVGSGDYYNGGVCLPSDAMLDPSDNAEYCLKCYYADAQGQPFGAPVADSFCASGTFAIQLGCDGNRYCYNQSSAQKAFGSPADGAHCSP